MKLLETYVSTNAVYFLKEPFSSWKKHSD